MKSLFRCEIFKFRAKSLKVEERYLEGNVTRLESFAAEIWELQQKMGILNDPYNKKAVLLIEQVRLQHHHLPHFPAGRPVMDVQAMELRTDIAARSA